ncbi:TAXI family TRAP transporter solute-binding subunit [Paludisphaera soli]|uniref:TAXI family TRAP transporter solute-binding subunit n=1 Tax=Paludisphaera soli TaxID=2712865 RepID=UPI0013ED4D91|nr:TAXI family TRAP transporter solute-binding subunit [Paludisphaera soli]
MAEADVSGLEGPPSSSRRRGTVRRAIGAWLWVGAFATAVVAASYVLFVEPPPPRRLVIASGAQGGAYFRFANLYAEDLRRHGLEVEVRETAGSVENLERLRDASSGVAVAIVQSGLVDGEDREGRLAALGSLYREPLWVFHRRGLEVDRLGGLKGLRIGVGAEGSGTQAVALRMLAANGLAEGGASPGDAATRYVREDAADAVALLLQGDLDAACFVAAFEAEYVQELLQDERVELLSFDRQEAYRRRFRFLAPITLPTGVVDLARNLPGRDVALLAPTAMLVVRDDFHPALVPLLLAAAARIHGEGGVLAEPREFPSESFCDLPVSEDARRFYRHGQPVLQRLLPFWLASLADRAKLMLIPLVMLLMPLVRAAPPLIRWRTRRKIYRWYAVLREIDQKLESGMAGVDLDREVARLRSIEHKVVWVEVPLSYMEEFYQLRMHLTIMQQRLMALRVGDP